MDQSTEQYIIKIHSDGRADKAHDECGEKGVEMRVLITGANGMLATNIIEVLLEKGYNVRGILRSKNTYKGNSHSHLELFEGDFTDIDTISKALHGCDHVIHAAAITSQSLLRYEDYKHVNTEATRQLVCQSEVNHIKKIIYVSSANTIGCGTHSAPANENTVLKPPLSRSCYGRSKVYAERAVLEHNCSMERVIVNPTFMIGRYGHTGGSNRILKMAHRVTFCPPGGKNFIDVEDAAQGVVAALERGNNGEKYLIAGENISYKDFFRQFSLVKHIVVIPRWVMIAAGFGGSLCRLLGIKTALSLTNMRILCLPAAYDNSKACNNLRLSPHPVSSVINRAVRA